MNGGPAGLNCEEPYELTRVRGNLHLCQPPRYSVKTLCSLFIYDTGTEVSHTEVCSDHEFSEVQI